MCRPATANRGLSPTSDNSFRVSGSSVSRQAAARRHLQRKRRLGANLVGVRGRSRRTPLHPRTIAAGGDTQQPAHRGDPIVGLWWDRVRLSYSLFGGMPTTSKPGAIIISATVRLRVPCLDRDPALAHPARPVGWSRSRHVDSSKPSGVQRNRVQLHRMECCPTTHFSRSQNQIALPLSRRLALLSPRSKRATGPGPSSPFSPQ